MKKVREGYKMTELGEIPSDWEIRAIKDIFSVRRESFNPRNEDECDYIGLEHIEAGTGRILGVGKSTETLSNKSKFYKNDILFGKLRPYLRKYWYSNIDGVCSTEIIPLQTNNNYNSLLGFYLIQNENFIEYINAKTFGTKMPRASWDDMKGFKVAISKLEKEQQKIASILSTVDEHIDNVNELIEKNKELKKGLMQQLLTKGIGHTKFKKTEIGEIPEAWEVKKLGEIFRLSSGNFLSQKNIVNGSYPVYGGNGITGYHNEFLFVDAKLVIGRVGAKCGCVCISEPNAWITDNALYISEKIEIFNDNYMYYLLDNMNLNSYANQNAQPVISGQNIYSISVGFPSIKEQEKIASILLESDEKIEEYENKKQKLEELKKGLMQQLLTGKIRVI